MILFSSHINSSTTNTIHNIFINLRTIKVRVKLSLSLFSFSLQQDSNPQPLARKRTLNDLAKLAKWLICVLSTYLYSPLTVCFYHLTYVFRVNLHSSSLNVKEILIRNRRNTRCSYLIFRYRPCFEQRVS